MGDALTDRLAALDESLFDPVCSQTTTEDKRSLLAVQCAVRSVQPAYVYLEIGSHLGGSLQTHLVDPLCSRAYSVDPRPPQQPDERGEVFYYPGNSTATMLDGLQAALGPVLDKLSCLEARAPDLDPTAFHPRPHLCLIDGEHTDRSVLADAVFCDAVTGHSGIIVFHDANIVYGGIGAFLEHLAGQGRTPACRFLPDHVFVVETGTTRFLSHPMLDERARNNALGYLAGMEANRHYRDVALSVANGPHGPSTPAQ